MRFPKSKCAHATLTMLRITDRTNTKGTVRPDHLFARCLHFGESRAKTTDWNAALLGGIRRAVARPSTLLRYAPNPFRTKNHKQRGSATSVCISSSLPHECSRDSSSHEISLICSLAQAFAVRCGESRRVSILYRTMRMEASCGNPGGCKCLKRWPGLATNSRICSHTYLQYL